MEKKYFGHYNSNTGDYEGFYPTDIYTNISEIPTPNIELTKEEWREARSSKRFRVIENTHTEVPYTSEEENIKSLSATRTQRDSLLKETDWVVLPHSPITGSKLDEWVTYRQALRDVTSQTPPYTLPTKPE